jgi:hypothetical protein
MPGTRHLIRAARLGLPAMLIALIVLGAPSRAWATAGWAWPVRGPVITSYRNGDDPYARGQHRGIDIAAPVGAQVGAATAGTVRFVGSVGSSGLTVSVRTADGRYDTSYLHLSSVAVRAGGHVNIGERIGAVGTTGRRSAVAPHLHFGVREAGSRNAYQDPLDFLPAPPPPPAPRVPSAAPVTVPAPLRTNPVPARRPARAPAARRFPSPARRPLGRRSPVARPLPRRVPQGAPGLRPAPDLAPAHSAEVRRPAPHRAEPEAHFSLGGAPHVTPAPSPSAAPRHAPAGEAPRPSAGPDLGWALACVGLLLAAGLVGGTEDGRNAAARGRTRVASALRPLFGRR